MKNSFFLTLIALSPFLFTSCFETDCSGCEERIDELRSEIAGDCDRLVIYGDACSDFVFGQSVGIIRETCHEGDNYGLLTCNFLGKDDIDFGLSVFGDIPEEVRLEILYDQASIDVFLDDNVSIVREFSQFVPANVLINTTLFRGGTSEILFEATPKVTFDRVTSSDVLRAIEVRHDINNGYRLFFYNWE